MGVPISPNIVNSTIKFLIFPTKKRRKDKEEERRKKGDGGVR